MRIGKVVLNLEDLSADALEEVIKEAKALRIRKIDHNNFCRSLEALLANAREEGFTFCEKHTGEVLKASDYVLYDDTYKCLHEGEWEH